MGHVDNVLVLNAGSSSIAFAVFGPGLDAIGFTGGSAKPPRRSAMTSSTN